MIKNNAAYFYTKKKSDRKHFQQQISYTQQSINMKRLFITIIIGFYTISSSAQVSFGDAEKINDNWKFQKGDYPAAANPAFDDSNWRVLHLPHDWSVEGPYSPDLASCTGYLPGGIAWYRKHINIVDNKDGSKVYIYFEGVYRDGEVFINGHSLGMRPNGYVSYMHELTPYLNYGGENVIAVRVDHSQHADSRWYTGSGIYRDVYLIQANPVHIDQWGVYYTTPEVSKGRASMQVQTTVVNHTDKPATLNVLQELKDREGNRVARISDHLRLPAGEKDDISQSMNISQPELWSVGNPYLYVLHTTIMQEGDIIDHTSTQAGIREFEFTPDKGFYLNGENMKLKGVCLHHDAGSLGAAVPREVWERRLKILKSLGTNAIRTSHNPQAPDLYHLADELGFLVINEAFDEWEHPKKKWLEGWNVGTPGFQGHYAFFEEWGETDLRDMILRDRNHPSVIMWSIGNEVDYPNDPYTHEVLDDEGIGQQHIRGFQPDQPHASCLGDIAHRLAAVVRELDPSRPVTAGLAGVVMSNETTYPDALDVVGYNYTENRYQTDHESFPDRIIYGSENRHDMNAWKAVRDNDHISGQFLWTGIDYLGESHRWPSRGFTTGLIDLAGFKKGRGYFRQSLWSDQPMIYLGTYPARNERNPGINASSHWNYQKEEMIRVVSYTNCEEAQLMLNGEKFKSRKSDHDDTGVITWDIPYDAGKLEVVGYIGGEEAARYFIETSKRPHAIRAEAWKDKVSADRGVAQIEIQVVDKNGVPVYFSDNEITCTIQGPARLLALEASNPRDMGDYTNNRLRVHNGRMIAYIEATGKKGTATINFSSQWLENAAIEITLE